MCSVPGRRDLLVSTRDTATEPEEGETDANRTERDGFGEKDDECVCVRMFCAHACANMSGSDPIRSPGC